MRNFITILIFFVFLSPLLEFPLHAEEFTPEGELTAALFGVQIIPVTTFGRQVRPVNLVAENITVITSADIERLHAQSLVDVLQYYPGVIAYPMRMAGDFAVPMVQGLPNRQTLVTIDGLPLNNVSDGVVDIGVIPTGFIERIEIVKGPASSVWGRSVGAVINIVSKEPNKNRQLSGQMSGTLGTNHSGYGDINFNGYFPKSGTGYFLAATGNQTKGFFEGINTEGRSVYAKLTQELGSDTDITALFSRSAAKRNILNIPAQNVRAESDGSTYFGIGKIHHRFGSGSDFDAQVYIYDITADTPIFNLKPIPQIIPVSGVRVQAQGVREESQGLQLSYKKSTPRYWLTLGVDAKRSWLRNSEFSLAPPTKDTSVENDPYNVAEYLSTGYLLTDKLTLTGSYRFDWYSQLQNTHSPNVGLIYSITDKSIIRATYGYGYSLPTTSSGTKEFETLWRTQVGIETGDVPFLWLKLFGFYDRTSNVKLQLKFYDQGVEKNHSLTREGFEIEAKTAPVFNTSFGLGYTYAHIFNNDTDEVIKGLPKHHLLASVNYRAHGTDAVLFARYINWNGESSTDQIVWDLLLSQRVFSFETGNANITFSARNIFNSSQQSSNIFANPPLRIDAGLLVNF